MVQGGGNARGNVVFPSSRRGSPGRLGGQSDERRAKSQPPALEGHGRESREHAEVQAEAVAALRQGSTP